LLVPTLRKTKSLEEKMRDFQMDLYRAWENEAQHDTVNDEMIAQALDDEINHNSNSLNFNFHLSSPRPPPPSSLPLASSSAVPGHGWSESQAMPRLFRSASEPSDDEKLAYRLSRAAEFGGSPETDMADSAIGASNPSYWFGDFRVPTTTAMSATGSSGQPVSNGVTNAGGASTTAATNATTTATTSASSASGATGSAAHDSAARRPTHSDTVAADIFEADVDKIVEVCAVPRNEAVALLRLADYDVSKAISLKS